MSKRVSVIGAGTIGASWAAIFLARGYEVAATDPSPNGEAFARRFVDTAWPTLRKLGLVVEGADLKRMSFHKDVASTLAGTEFVQENGPEREDLKIELFAAMDAVLPADVVIASSSSGLLISRITAKCKHPERCVIGHPFIRRTLFRWWRSSAAPSSPQTIAKAMEFYRALGKHPIHQKGNEGSCRQPAASRALARGHSSRRRGRGFSRRRRRRDRLWSRPALGADGPNLIFDLAGGEGRHDAFHGSSRRGEPKLDG